MKRHQVPIRFLALFALISGACAQSDDFASLNGEWAENVQSGRAAWSSRGGEVSVIVLEDSIFVLENTRGEDIGPTKLYSMRDSVIQISDDQRLLTVRYKTQRENTIFWTIGQGFILEIQRLSQNEIGLVVFPWAGSGLGPNGRVTLADAIHVRSSTFTKREGPPSEAYRSLVDALAESRNKNRSP